MSLFPLLLALSLPARAAPPAKPARSRTPYGILILAHGAGREWDSQVYAVRDAVNKRVPAEVAFGMAAPDAMQAGIDRLEARGLKRIAVVPLFINSHSSVMDQTRYALHLRAAPSMVFIKAMKRLPPMVLHMAGMDFDPRKQVAIHAKLVMTPALDDDPLVAGILIARAKALSRDPSKETVILVGHGPVDRPENNIWLETMRSLCRQIKKAGGFKNAWAATIRDDAPPPVKARADAVLRALVRKADRNGGR
ncbi:MAG: hypothetical protein KGI84_05385, partial [Elusimicrobia bacterium]|nr:hypothetical protein [Elusimicrobiota bacterium]